MRINKWKLNFEMRKKNILSLFMKYVYGKSRSDNNVRSPSYCDFLQILNINQATKT